MEASERAQDFEVPEDLRSKLDGKATAGSAGLMMRRQEGQEKGEETQHAQQELAAIDGMGKASLREPARGVRTRRAVAGPR